MSPPMTMMHRSVACCACLLSLLLFRCLVAQRIPCGNGTFSMIALQSNTKYLLEDCVVAPELFPHADGRRLPVLLQFTGVLTSAAPAISNVDIVVRNSNVLPVVHFESTTPGLVGARIENVSVTVVSLEVTWPDTIAAGAAKPILSVQDVTFVNVTQTLHDCRLNLTFPPTTTPLPVIAGFVRRTDHEAVDTFRS
jgi:hypothetical protein